MSVIRKKRTFISAVARPLSAKSRHGACSIAPGRESREKDPDNAGSFLRHGQEGSLRLGLLHRLLDRFVGVAYDG